MSPPKRCRILCAGIVVLDELFPVKDFPPARRQGRGERVLANLMRERCMRFGGSPTILTRAEVEAFLRGI